MEVVGGGAAASGAAVITIQRRRIIGTGAAGIAVAGCKCIGLSNGRFRSAGMLTATLILMQQGIPAAAGGLTSFHA